MTDKVNMIKITHPKKDDLEAIFKFMIACDIADMGEADSSREDLEEEWGELDLEQDAWIVMEDGIIRGYASLTGANARFILDMYVHEALTPPGWSDSLLQAGEERMLQKKDPQVELIPLTVYSTSSNRESNLLLKRNGFNVHTWHYRMQIDLTVPFAEVPWPGGFVVRTFQPEDEVELYELIRTTFDWGDHVMPPIETWRSQLFRSGRYDSDLFIVVRKEGRLVGAVLAYNEAPLGWIRQLAIARDLQGLGFGSMLLRHAFHVFTQKGLTSAALGVASVNQKAFQFYERCGMKKTREFIEYRKVL